MPTESTPSLWDVHVVGLGAQTSVGRTAASSFMAVRAGISRMARHPSYRDGTGRGVVVSRASYLPDDLPLSGRLVDLLMPAIDEALTPLKECGGGFEPIPAVIGLPLPRADMSSSIDGEIVREIRSRFFEEIGIGDIQLIATSHTAGLMAIEQACKRIRVGHSALCLACGVDSSVSVDRMSWLDSCGRLRTRETPLGLTPGEAAGACLLASPSASSRLRSLGRVLYASTATDKNDESGDGEEGFRGLSKAWHAVLESLPENAKVGQTISDANGERARDLELQTAFVKMMSRFERDLGFCAPAVSWGDVGAASGPLFAGLAVIDGVLNGGHHSRTLISTSSDDGNHSAALIEVRP